MPILARVANDGSTPDVRESSSQSNLQAPTFRVPIASRSTTPKSTSTAAHHRPVLADVAEPSPRSASLLPPVRASAPTTGTRLGVALLAYLLGVTLIITLLPFQFGWPSRVRVMFTGDIVDVIGNVLLFLPLGFLYRLSRHTAHRHSVLRVLGIGVLASMAIESAQVFEAERYSSLLDVVCNGAGAWLGALLYDRVAERTRVDARFIGRLSLELPLMGLIYLLVPLLWLNGLSAGDSRERMALTLLLALFGASLLGGMQRHHFGPARVLTPRAMAIIAGAWFIAGAFPGVPRHPAQMAVIGIVVVAFVWWRGSRPLERTPLNRRFEVPLLLSAAPVFAAYLLLLAFAPLLDGAGAWSWGIGFRGAATEWGKVEILRTLEIIAAFTLLGYMLAEFRGRRNESYRRSARHIVQWGGAIALVAECALGFRAGHGASVTQLALIVTGSLYGGWLYLLQRDHVLALLAARQAER